MRGLVQMLPGAGLKILQSVQVHHALSARATPMPLAEFPHGLRPESRDGARLSSVGIRGSSQPSDVALPHQPYQLALAEHGVAHIQARELDLLRMEYLDIVQIPIVKRAMIFIFERADGVRNPLDGVRLPVREIIHGVDFPGVARARMGGMQHAIHDRIAQIDVAARHVNLGAQDRLALLESASAHLLEKRQVLVRAALAVGAVPARLGERAAIFAYLVGARFIDVGAADADELKRHAVELLKVVRGVIEAVAPIKAEPAQVFGDGVDVFLLFCGGIGVVEAQVAQAAVALRDAKVQADGLGVPDMQVAIRLRRKACVHDAIKAARFVVRVDDVGDEVSAAVDVGHG